MKSGARRFILVSGMGGKITCDLLGILAAGMEGGADSMPGTATGAGTPERSITAVSSACFEFSLLIQFCLSDHSLLNLSVLSFI